MNPERDIRSVRFVGTLALGIGMVLLVLTILGTLFALFAGATSDPNQFLRGIVVFMIALVMSTSLMGCGAQLQAARLYGWTDIENIRLVWTGLVIVLTLCTIAALWVIPPLAYLGGLMLFALFTIRGAIIRLSSR